jgi:hypothetical protein
MNDLAAIHGVAVNHNCVNCGFDWRTGKLNSSLSDTFGNNFLRPRNLKLAQNAMMTDSKAGRLFPQKPIPIGIRVLMASVNDSPVLPQSASSCSTSNMDMSPDFVESIYALRKDKGSKRRQAGQADAQLDKESPADYPEYLLEMSTSAARARRAAGQISALRNLELFEKEMDQNDDDDDDDCSSDEGIDWNAENDDSVHGLYQ